MKSIDKYLVDDLAKEILETFSVSPEEARNHATGILASIDSHGGEPGLPDAFCHALRLYGEKLPWRSQMRRHEWASRKEASVAGYTAHLDSARQSPFKKW